MKLTVATVALNAARDLPLTLESILGQDYPDIELLVVDGASWDETPQVLALYSNAIDRVEIVEDGGIFDAMNRAARFATGEMILFLNAGDRFYSADALSRMMARRNPDAGIIYGNHIYRDKGVEDFRSSWDFGAAMRALRRGAVSQQWLERFPAHQSTITRTDLLRELKYDTAFRICADHDFFLRAVELGVPTQFIDEVVSIYVGGGFSLQRHELLKLEWNALHRRFSADPERVDAWYYGGASPFTGTRSPAAGEVVSGLGAEEPARLGRGINHPFRFMFADGARFVSPLGLRASALYLRGTNPFGRQNVDVFAGSQRIAQSVVPSGVFAVDFVFAEPVEPGILLDVIPEFGERFGDSLQLVSLALREFSFSGDATTTPRRVGTPIKFNRQSAGENAELMGSGWYDFEQNFIWSRGTLSEVRLSSNDRITQMHLEVRPNPGLPGQRCVIVVNGEAIFDSIVAPSVTAPVGHLWRDGGRDNVISFRPSASASVGGDPRDLGIALVSITLS